MVILGMEKMRSRVSIYKIENAIIKSLFLWEYKTMDKITSLIVKIKMTKANHL